MVIKENKLVQDTKTSISLELQFINILNKYLGHLGSEQFVFISYKHGEEDNVHRLITLLEKHGLKGYVDFEDDSMPKETSGETALKLKDKIRESYKFVLLATNSAIESKWCNWEVGFADTHKYIDHIALLPLIKENDEFEGKEYLQIYPTIQVKSNLNDNSEYYVQYPNGNEISLSKWLTL